jgi:hypothetical protein
MNKMFKVLSRCFITVILLIITVSCSNEPKQFCFVVDTECPVSYLNLNITPWEAVMDPNIGNLLVQGDDMLLSGEIENVNKGLYVEGYEINFGFWSKDSYRYYSVIDYLKEQGRPITQEEIASVSEIELRNWFNNKHKVKRPWYLGGDDWPRDVHVGEKIERKGPCMTLPVNHLFDINGYVIFANGMSCSIEPINMYDPYTDASISDSKIVLKVKQPCSACNNN